MAEHLHGLSQCRLQALGANQLCSRFLTHLHCTELLSGLFPTGIMEETAPGLGPVAVSRPPLPPTQPNLFPQPAHSNCCDYPVPSTCPLGLMLSSHMCLYSTQHNDLVIIAEAKSLLKLGAY